MVSQDRRTAEVHWPRLISPGGHLRLLDEVRTVRHTARRVEPLVPYTRLTCKG
jgi:hypothetical protein